MEKRLREMIKEAMVAKRENNTKENGIRYQTLKNILETAQKIAKQTNVEVNDKFIIDAAKKEIKQANDVLEYVKNNEDRKKETMLVISVCEEILPAMASEEDIRKYLEDNNVEKNMGACMKSLKAHFGDLLDGKVAQGVVKTYIA